MNDKIWEVLKDKITGEVPTEVALLTSSMVSYWLKETEAGVNERLKLAEAGVNERLSHVKINTNSLIEYYNNRRPTKDEVLGTVEKTIKELQSNLGKLIEEEGSKLRDDIKNLATEIEKIEQETKTIEGITEKGFKNVEQNINRSIDRKAEEILKTITKESGTTQFNHYTTYQQILNALRAFQTETGENFGQLTTNIENILGKSRDEIRKELAEMNYTQSVGHQHIINGIGSLIKKMEGERLEELKKMIEEYNENGIITKTLKELGLEKRYDLKNFLKEITKKTDPNKLRYRALGEVDYRHYAELWKEGKRRAFTDKEILDYVVNKDTRKEDMKELVDDMFEWVYESRRKSF